MSIPKDIIDIAIRMAIPTEPTNAYTLPLLLCRALQGLEQYSKDTNPADCLEEFDRWWALIEPRLSGPESIFSPEPPIDTRPDKAELFSIFANSWRKTTHPFKEVQFAQLLLQAKNDPPIERALRFSEDLEAIAKMCRAAGGPIEIPYLPLAKVFGRTDAKWAWRQMLALEKLGIVENLKRGAAASANGRASTWQFVDGCPIDKALDAGAVGDPCPQGQDEMPEPMDEDALHDEYEPTEEERREASRFIQDSEAQRHTDDEAAPPTAGESPYSWARKLYDPPEANNLPF